MADSSSCELGCFQCKETNTTSFRNGWRLHNGQFAQLCDRCSSLYEEGKFCGTFHLNDDGWRDCKICGKERKQYLKTKHENKEAQGKLASEIQIKPQHWPRATASELEQVVRNNSSVSPLFEKSLSSTDVDQKLGRLIIPKQCAKAYFPKINTHDGCPISILDGEGKEWDFWFRYWNCSGYKTYVLEGLQDFVVSKQWQQGDVVTFFRTKREEKVGHGIKKDSFMLTTF